jgi:hypothetical protein
MVLDGRERLVVDTIDTSSAHPKIVEYEIDPVVGHGRRDENVFRDRHSDSRARHGTRW